MSNLWRPDSASRAITELEQRYEDLIATGSAHRFIYPWATLGSGAVILYLLVDHRQSRFLSRLRYAVWLLNTAACLYTVAFIRCKNNAPALGIGIVSGWQILWSASFMLFEDCQTDYARMKEIPDTSGPRREDTFADTAGDRVAANGSQKPKASNISAVEKDLTHRRSGIKKNRTARGSVGAGAPQRTFCWQRYPNDSLKERLFWVLDLLTNVRGINWNWRVSSTSPPPRYVQEALASDDTQPPSLPSKPSSARPRDLLTRRAVIIDNVYLFARNYAILDVVKLLMCYDPYFWGWPYAQAGFPSYLPATLQRSHIAARVCRLVLCLTGIKCCLEMIFTLGPLLIVGLLGPSIVGHKAEPWMHPRQFGSVSLLFTHGLAGFWGAFWHQVFRKTFEVPGDKLVTKLGLSARSQSAKVVKLFVAFALSGFIHACGSATQLGATNPITGSFLFFLLQAVGMTLETVIQKQLKHLGVTGAIPLSLRQLCTFSFCFIWLYFTAPLLCDDFALGGAWLFEPIPVSLLRGPLGLGPEQDGWFRWAGLHIHWHRGDTWWQSGIIV